jgi:hypothetical protein
VDEDPFLMRCARLVVDLLAQALAQPPITQAAAQGLVVIGVERVRISAGVGFGPPLSLRLGLIVRGVWVCLELIIGHGCGRLGRNSRPAASDSRAALD